MIGFLYHMSFDHVTKISFKDRLKKSILPINLMARNECKGFKVVKNTENK